MRKAGYFPFPLILLLSGCTAGGIGAKLNSIADPVILLISAFSILIPTVIIVIRKLVKDKRESIVHELVKKIPGIEIHSLTMALAQNITPTHLLGKKSSAIFFSASTYTILAFAGFYTAMSLSVFGLEHPPYLNNFLVYGFYAAAPKPPDAGPSAKQASAASSGPGHEVDLQKIYTQ
jgi:hypothetical protein